MIEIERQLLDQRAVSGLAIPAHVRFEPGDGETAWGSADGVLGVSDVDAVNEDVQL